MLWMPVVSHTLWLLWVISVAFEMFSYKEGSLSISEHFHFCFEVPLLLFVFFFVF